jgi:Fatty acid hydroxylase
VVSGGKYRLRDGRMTNPRLQAFREAYRERVTPWYNGYFHIFIVYATGAAAFYIYVSHIHDVKPFEWLMIPFAFLVANGFEWYLHKYIMHRPPSFKPLRTVYLYHMIDHHQFFTDDDMQFRDHMDWRITVFPPYALTIFILTATPFAFLFGYLISPNIGWLFMCVVTAMYLLYEFIHFCCHLEENWFVRNCPLINSMRRHHTAHHNQRLMMEVNMNVTFPIIDWLLGTSDLNRGLLGHLFNGYDTTHVKRNLRAVPKPPGENPASDDSSSSTLRAIDDRAQAAHH